MTIKARFIRKPGPDDHFKLGEIFAMNQRCFGRWKAKGYVEEVPHGASVSPDKAEPAIQD